MYAFFLATFFRQILYSPKKKSLKFSKMFLSFARWKYMRVCVRKSFLFVLFLLGSALCFAEKPSVVYASYLGDPTSSIVLFWHTSMQDEASSICYKKVGDASWNAAEGSFVKPNKYETYFHSVAVKGLEADSIYQFRIGREEKLYQFRTLSGEDHVPVRYVTGGDAYRYLSLFRKMNRTIAKQNPDFIVVGGDVAYSHGGITLFKGKGWEMRRWMTFLQEWQKTMVDSFGCMIPLIPVVGNHDVKKALSDPRQGSVLFYELFFPPDQYASYRVLDIGKKMSLLLLDTGHTAPIESQVGWIEDTLKERASTAFPVAIYHVGAYPSVYPYQGGVPTKIRSTWSPIFEKYRLRLAFENHNHAYKRTYPLKEDQFDPEGVIYMGDGCWGVAPRKTRSNLWYVEKKASKNCCTLIVADTARCAIEVFDIGGKIIDSLQLSPFAAEEMASVP